MQRRGQHSNGDGRRLLTQELILVLIRVENGNPFLTVLKIMDGLPQYKRKKSRNRTVDRSDAHFAPYFDFGELEESAPQTDPVKLLIDACQVWIDKGNQIDRYVFGVRSEGLLRSDDGHGNITQIRPAFYRASGEICCPLGIILIDTESHFMPLLDAARILQVDHLWIVGFVHAIDGASIVSIGKNVEEFSKHDSYLKGKQAGKVIGAKFIKERAAA